MLFHNEYEIEQSLRQFNDVDTANYFVAATALSRLAGWANQNSDGWHSWPKPARAAKRLMEALDRGKAEYRQGFEVTDLTEAQLKSLLTPVKSFLTRQGVDSSTVLGF